MCQYCNEDFDGYYKPLDKMHMYVYLTLHTKKY